MTTRPVITESLKVNPRLNYTKWIRHVHNTARAIFITNGNSFYSYGTTLNDVDFRRQHAASIPLIPGHATMTTTELRAQIEPRRPNPPAGNAAAGTVQVYRDELALWQDFEMVKANFKVQLFNPEIVGPQVYLHFTAATFDYDAHSISDLLNIIFQLHGTPTMETFTEIHTKLTTPFRTDLPFGQQADQFLNYASIATAANQPYSNFQLISFLTAACAHNSSITKTIEHYNNEHPDVALRNINNLITFINDRGSHVMSTPVAAYSVPGTLPDATSTTSELDEDPSAAALRRKIPNRPPGATPIQRGRPKFPLKPLPPGTIKYCCEHRSSNTHSSDECNVMNNNPDHYRTIDFLTRTPEDVKLSYSALSSKYRLNNK